MKWLKDLFDSQKKHFEKGGKFERFYPLYEANRTLFFIPGHTAPSRPHVRDGLDLKRLMSFVIIALLPHFFFGVYNAGYFANLNSGLPLDLVSVMQRGFVIVLPLVIVSYGVGLFWEGLFSVIRKHAISEGFLVTGLLYPLILPPTLPLWQAAVGITFGVIIGKEVFGGTGKNLVNPALTARAFVFFAYPVTMSGDSVWIASKAGATHVADAVSGATALAVSAAAAGPAPVEQSLAKAGFTLKTLFWGMYPGCIGETSTFLCIIGALFLCLTGIASYRIIVGGIIGVLAMGLFLNFIAQPSSSPYMSLNPLYHLVMGGVAFGITYMATDPVTGPGMNRSKWIYGFFIGVLTVIIRIFNPAYPEGAMLAILFMNMFAPLFDYIEIKVKLKKRIPNV
ncbi:MAG: NADH:ubiquinone reductase (Na(+)-transporting) subunit B [Proteobacteria bacterium]|nr:NADH:ubiquinone reductase (Na(+)-transporting) subunit B [Pseudomonadota bacterium]